jgi:beta-phosphoglucomutase-like phosphatase (HAD superfamily)
VSPRARPRKPARRRTADQGAALLATFARRIERHLDRQEERLRMQGDSYDAVRRAHDEKHRQIEERLAALERGQDDARATLVEMRRLLEGMRDVVEPLRELLGRLRASHLRTAAPPPAPPEVGIDQTTSSPERRVAGA